MKRIGRIFVVGLLAALPLFLTAFLAGWLLTLVNQLFGPDSTLGGLLISLGLGISPSAPYLVGIAVVVGAIYALGILVESRLGSWASGAVDRLIRRIPLVSNVYDLSSRFVSIVDSRDGNSLKGMSPAWCFFGGKPGAAVLALLPTTKPVRLGGEDYLCVLIPSAPVPFGGALIYVPAAWIEPAAGRVDDLMSVYVSMGITPPASQT
jgi:uncharacterized membrane protein